MALEFKLPDIGEGIAEGEIVQWKVTEGDTVTEHQAIVEEGLALAEIHRNVTVKVPLIADGLAACRDLTRQNVKVNVTLCFTPVQALLAAKAGATLVAVDANPVDAIWHDQAPPPLSPTVAMTSPGATHSPALFRVVSL